LKSAAKTRNAFRIDAHRDAIQRVFERSEFQPCVSTLGGEVAE